MPYRSQLLLLLSALLLYSVNSFAQPAPIAPAATPPAAGGAAPAGAAPTGAAQTGDTGRVGDHDTTLADELPPDQILWLTADKDKFLARYQPDLTGLARGAVIILHDSGQHPSWPFTAAALIDNLPLHGWNTLSIELPVPAQDATPAPTATGSVAAPTPAPTPAAAPANPASPPAAGSPTAGSPAAGSPIAIEPQAQARIAAALTYFTEQKQTTVALIGFGSGAYRAAEFVRALAAANPTKTTAPIVLLALVAPVNRLAQSTSDLPKLLPETELTTLDLILSNEPQARLDATLRARAVLHQRKRIYEQVELPPNNPDLNPAQNTMVKRVRGFLQKQSGKGPKN